MGTIAQLQSVATQCPQYSGGKLVSNIDEKSDISCASCKNWDGRKCTANMFDKVLTGMDQS